MRLIVAGGRDFSDKKLMQEALNDYTFDTTSLEIVSGTAKGADSLGAQLARANNIPVKEFPADWQDMSEPCVKRFNGYGTYNALAGMKRNHQMGDYATHLIAFWDGKSTGTKDMIEYMRSLNKPFKVIGY